jgi:hypothetical protein
MYQSVHRIGLSQEVSEKKYSIKVVRIETNRKILIRIDDVGVNDSYNCPDAG